MCWRAALPHARSPEPARRPEPLRSRDSSTGRLARLAHPEAVGVAHLTACAAPCPFSRLLAYLTHLLVHQLKHLPAHLLVHEMAYPPARLVTFRAVRSAKVRPGLAVG